MAPAIPEGLARVELILTHPMATIVSPFIPTLLSSLSLSLCSSHTTQTSLLSTQEEVEDTKRERKEIQWKREATYELEQTIEEYGG